MTGSVSVGGDVVASDVYPSWMTAAVGEWAQISGTTARSALKDYSGVAVRDDETGVTVIDAAPGGHSGNVTNNSVRAIVLSGAAPAWSTLLAASDTTGTNLGTGGGGTGADEVMASDGHPTPRHLYTDIFWVPELGRVMIGGEAGGAVVCAGTPETVTEHATSHTGRALGPVLARA